MKAFQKYVLVKKAETQQQTSTGIYINNDNDGSLGVKATIVSGETGDLKEGDEIWVYRPKLFELGNEGIYAIEPEFILAVE